MTNPEGKKIFGIDLGTSNSSISIWDDELGEVKVLGKMIPSLVGWHRKSEQWIVGEPNLNSENTDFITTAYAVKRYIGRWYNDRNVQNGLSELTYKLESGGGKDQLRDVFVNFGFDKIGQPVLLSIPEISGKILYSLREEAALSLKMPIEEIEDAVITVPAYFNALQRHATELAGLEAGLNVREILNEPTAAALTYEEILIDDEEKRILVFDMGGGTLDISIMEVMRLGSGYMFDTLAVDGNTRLGGFDIDNEIVHFLENEIHRITDSKPNTNHRIVGEQLRRAAENAKINLSLQDNYEVHLSGLDIGKSELADVRINISRDDLEKCAQAVVREAVTIATQAVDIAELSMEDLSEVLLVGGQTLMPIIQEEIAKVTGIKPRVMKEPQLAVALGAGKRAQMLSKGKQIFGRSKLINVMALPIGVRVLENDFKCLVKAKAKLPIESDPFVVTTTRDEQTSIHVEIYQGRRETQKVNEEHCVLLGSIDMDIPPAPKGFPAFSIVCKIKNDGTMRVDVTDIHLQKTKTLDIINTAIASRKESQSDS